jgi:hypothetical protein
MPTLLETSHASSNPMRTDIPGKETHVNRCANRSVGLCGMKQSAFQAWQSFASFECTHSFDVARMAGAALGSRFCDLGKVTLGLLCRENNKNQLS